MDAPTVDESGTFNLGESLRAVRKAAGLSQRELARRTGVTHTTVSLIELNQVSPSIASLKKLLAGIPMSLAEFFTKGEEKPPQVFFKANELVELGSGGVSLLQVAPNLKNRRLQVLYERYGPGADTGETPYAHEGEEAGVVISGSIEITAGDQVQILHPGDAYYFDSTMLHRFRNISSEECVIVSACTPPTF